MEVSDPMDTNVPLGDLGLHTSSLDTPCLDTPSLDTPTIETMPMLGSNSECFNSFDDFVDMNIDDMLQYTNSDSSSESQVRYCDLSDGVTNIRLFYKDHFIC